MQSRILGLLALLTFTTSCEGLVHEASMNFDLESVRPFLERLNSELGLELDVQRLVEFTSGVAVDQELATPVSVAFEDQTLTLEYSIFMDDVDAPDVSFYSDSQALTDAITAQMEAFAEELGL